MFDTLFGPLSTKYFKKSEENQKFRSQIPYRFLNFKFNFSEDLLSYEIGDIDVHDDDGDELDDLVEDELLMSDDGNLLQ